MSNHNEIWLKVFSIMGVLIDWAAQALKDGVVTPDEGAALVTPICNILGVRYLAKVDLALDEATAAMPEQG
jgi:hypothetical protein